ncbi:MAG: hypothetical protein M3081_02750 [Gemmatimonadota bacterium]|nr:hypothetical protein [Gemmatimonadota bacterium]
MDELELADQVRIAIFRRPYIPQLQDTARALQRRPDEIVRAVHFRTHVQCAAGQAREVEEIRNER